MPQTPSTVITILTIESESGDTYQTHAPGPYTPMMAIAAALNIEEATDGFERASSIDGEEQTLFITSAYEVKIAADGTITGNEVTPDRLNA